MSKRIFILPTADKDLDDHAYFIARNKSDMGARFVVQAQSALDRLLDMPGLGRPRVFSRSELLGLRSWPVPDFPNHLIFYRVTDAGIEVILVLHGARDMDVLVDDDESHSHSGGPDS